MVDAGVRGVEFIALNTDAQALSMSDADLKNVALFYALQKPEKAKTPAAGDAAAGERAAAASCSGCHGDRGVTSSAPCSWASSDSSDRFSITPKKLG